ncbi:hypothetical protein ABZ901_30755 [Actinacidiphila alni]|uniref:hypothetical protein n=1 Tax=Actinacidiphila alni TaxID=380248 RepID=UPI0033F45978
MSQGEPAGGAPEPEPPSVTGDDDGHHGHVLVREVLTVITAVVQTLMNLVADLQAWCAQLESRANDAGAVDVTRRRRDLAEHQDRLVAAEALLTTARGKRDAAEELAIVARRMSGEGDRDRPRPAPPLVPVASDRSDAAVLVADGAPSGATENRLREVDRVLASARRRLDTSDAQVAAARAAIGSGGRPAPADAVPAGATKAGRAKGAATAGGAQEADDAPEDRRPPAPQWTTWLTVLTGCCLLLLVILAGTSFTYARWEHPGAGVVAVYAVGDVLALAAVVFLSLMVLGTLVERYELSTLGETSLVLAILLVVPVLGVGVWHPEAFGHMGMWGRSLARSLV